MSVISQIGTIVLILFIFLLIKESNKQVEKAAAEGEHFLAEAENFPVEPVQYVIENEVQINLGGKRARLVRMDKNHYPAQEIEITSFPFTIGRAPDNNLVLTDLCVARKHCLLTHKGEELTLKDLGTLNKIYANGKVWDEMELTEGQRFYIGNEEFFVDAIWEG